MSANHYVIVSDLHLCDVEDHADGWKRHKSSAWLFDSGLDTVVKDALAKLEPGDTFTWVLNGDIFDFDLVTAVPEPSPWPLRRLEHDYGLDPTGPRSAWKLERILGDHPLFVETIARLLLGGHRVVFTAGNHDRELCMGEVEAALRERIGACVETLRAEGLTEAATGLGPLIVEPWFFHVPGEIYIEHGHQYDHYSSFRFNLDPIVHKGGEAHLALPTGNLSNRYLLSNIGYFNPHATDFILSGLGYVRHWLKHYAFTRRMLIWTWIIGSLRSLSALVDTRRRLRRDPPADYGRHIEAAAHRNATSTEKAKAIYALREKPITDRLHLIVREFWIDRLLLAIAMTAGTVALALSDSPLWVKLVVPMGYFPLAWFFYQWVAGNENALTTESRAHTYAREIATILPVRAVVFGHTHVPNVTPLGPHTHFANSGTWAPTWEADTFEPTAGLRNHVHVRVPAGAALDSTGAKPAAEAKVEVETSLPLSPVPRRDSAA